ncbi:FMN-binding domain-containing protein [Beijerinckiaceae bacterium]|nr:FMN-binding domain-containing protein [Beijerinckiaceae bacterium]
MSDWVRWTAPAAAIAMALPAYAYQYTTVGGAQQQAFPGARFEEIQSQRVWKARAGDKVVGYFFVDHVIGKHLYIDYSVALDADGRVRRVEILTYRESYGGEVANASWLSQFIGKSSGSALEVNRDIRNISGATLSSRHVTEGVKRILAYYASHLR